jgi:hypothetical protein
MNKLSRLLIPALAITLVGCGSGGGGSSSGGNAQVGVFVTDSFREDYSHVWTTIYKIELVNGLSQSTTVFDDSAGRTIDVKTLRDSTGQRFSFLSNTTIPAGTYTGARVTVAPSLTLIGAASTMGTSLPLADSVPRDNLGHAQISLTFPTAKVINGANDVVIDFDLANFSIALGKIVPSLKDGQSGGLNDPARHEEGEYEGTVSALSGTSPNFTFTLTRGNQTTTVATDSSTVVFNAGASPNPTLANGKRVHIRGKFNATNDRLLAASIKIQANGDVDRPEAKGTPSAIDATNGTFKVTLTRASDFMPSQTTINVTTNVNTVFRGVTGVILSSTDFFTRLANSTTVEVEGSYNVTTNTITATLVKLEDEGNNGGGGHDHEAEARGTATNIGTSTFTMNPVSEFEGFNYTGGGLPVTTTGTTAFKSKTGATLTSTAFFTALHTNTTVKVTGTFTNGTLAALKAELK